MKFELTRQNCLLANFNPRRELHGDNPEPAADVTLSTNLPSAELAQFHPTLRNFLYHFDSSKADLADQASEDDAPHLRIPELKYPLGFEGEVIGAKVTIHYGTTDKSAIVLTGCNLSNFKIDPKDGGTITVGFRVQAHPDEKQAGKIYTMQGLQVEVSVEPPQADPELTED